MRASRGQGSLLVDADLGAIRGADCGDLQATFDSLPTGTDATSLLKGDRTTSASAFDDRPRRR
jgi:hypothetical protein